MLSPPGVVFFYQFHLKRQPLLADCLPEEITNQQASHKAWKIHLDVLMAFHNAHSRNVQLVDGSNQVFPHKLNSKAKLQTLFYKLRSDKICKV